MDMKILHWMIKGTVEINEVFRYIDRDMIENVFLVDYRDIVKSILEYYSKHKVPPSIDVLEELHKDDENDLFILQELRIVSCNENEIGHEIDKVRERHNFYLLKRLKKSIESSESSESRDINEEVKKLLVKTERLYKADVFSEGKISDSVQDRVDNYEYIKNNPKVSSGVLSGYRDLDDYTWGIKKSEMLVIGGASSSGKSLLMMNMAINAWLGDNDPISKNDISESSGKNVIYVSCEMTKPQLEHRIDANLAKITHKHLMRGMLTEEEESRWESSLEFQSKYGKVFYILDMARGCSVAEMEAKFETVCAQFKPDAIFVDYLQLMAPSNGPTGSDWQDVGKVSEELHEFCRKKNIPVITAAQRKAGAKKSGGKKYEDNIDLEDLGRSKMIGDNATVVMLIAKREDELLREDMEIHIVKNRDGAKGKVNLLKRFDQSRVETIPDGWAQDVGDENEI